MNNRVVMLVLAAAIALAGISCVQRDETKPGKRLAVVTTLFPLYDFAKRVAGERADVSLLLPPGAEPHGFEPRPADILRLNRADVFLYTSPAMEPWAADILKGLQNPGLEVVDTSRGLAASEGRGDKDPRHDHRDGHGRPAAADPHIWLDFSNAVRMVEAVRDGFVKKDPAGRDVYERNAAAAIEELKTLDERFRAGLQDCEKKLLVNGGHFAFDYMAKRYGFRYVSVYGVSPDAEPTAAELARITRLIRQNGLRHLFHEELVSPKLAETLSRESGVSLLKLHPAGNLTREQLDRGETFRTLMEQNLESLRAGMRCR